MFGPGTRGDEVPAELADPRSRAERIAAALAELDAEQDAARRRERQEHERAAEYLAAEPAAGRPPGTVEVEAARRRLERAIAEQEAAIAGWHARNAARAAEGRPRLHGQPPQPPAESGKVARARATLDRATQRAAGRQPAARQGKDQKAVTTSQKTLRNLTDPHSRLMPVRGGGFIQGYNAQLVTSSDGLILATQLTNDPVDTLWFEPMLRAAQHAAALITASHPAAGGHDDPGDSPPIGLILADAGYLSARNLTIDGPDRLIATGKNRDLTRHAAGTQHAGDWTDPAITAMAARLATDEGVTAYRHRSHIAETPNGNIKHNLGFRQLSVRGKPRATAEWTLLATVTNLLKAITSGHLTTPALAALAR